jgi:prophage DNA circulation protein
MATEFAYFCLLNHSFQPTGEIRVARAVWRQRWQPVASASSTIQSAQRVLIEVSIQLSNVRLELGGTGARNSARTLRNSYARSCTAYRESTGAK